MIILARASITLTHVADIVSVTWYYKLQASTAAAPAKPTTETPSGWTTTEPTYTEGSTNSLYVIQKTTFSDDSFEYSDVSLSSSYEAAKTAYNKSVQAKDTADAAQESIDNLQVGGRNLILNTLDPNASGSDMKRPHFIGQITNTSGRGTCTVAEHGIRFTCTSANWAYIYFGSSGNTATPCMLGLEVGETYTFSADLSWKILSSDTGKADATTRHMGAVLYYSTVDSGTFHAIGAVNQFPITQAEKGTEMSGRLEYTFTVPETAKRLYFGIKADLTSASYYATGDFIEARNLKLEKGNKATDWTPAPEDAIKEEQYIYVSKVSGTSSVSGTTTWVEEDGDVQNTWTKKRPTYSGDYPVLFVAKQSITVGGNVTCTTPLKDDTTTVIDGGHITTGTIDASQVTVTNIDASEIKSGTIDASQVTVTNIDASEIKSGTIDASRINAAQLRIGYNQLDDPRNMIINSVNPGLEPVSTRPRIEGDESSYIRTSAGTQSVVPHGIRITNTGESRTFLRFGSNDIADATMCGLTAGETYTLSFDVKYKLLSGKSETTTRYLRVSLVDNTADAGAFSTDEYANIQTLSTAYRGMDMSSTCVFTFTIPANVTKLYMFIAASQTNASHYAAGDYIEVTNLKLERGSTATPWGVVDDTEIGGRNYFALCNAVDGYLNPDGTIHANDSFREHTSDYIPVTEGEVLTLSTNVEEGDQPYLGYAFFDSEKSIIGRRTAGYVPCIAGIEVPEGAAYIRASYRTHKDTATGKLERGSVATDWTPAPEDIAAGISKAAESADTYITDITGGGIFVHPEDNEEDGVKIHDAIEIIKDGITYIKLWLDGANQDQPKVQVGDSENGAYFLIEKDKLSGKSQSHSYFETGEAGTTVKQVYRGDGINRQFGLYRASSITSVTVNGSAVTNYTLQHDTQTTYGLLTFGENATPSSGASIVIIYETTEQNPYFTFGTRDTESEVELPNGTMSATFGKKNNASGPCSFAEGSLNTVTGIAGHAEGDSNNVLAHAGHAEGGMNDVTGEYLHAEGYNNTVSGKYSHVGGYGNTAPYNYQTVIGYGAPIASSDDLFMAGNMDVAGERSAAMRLKRSGRVEFGGAVGSGLAWETRTEMINAMTGLSLNRPYSFYAGSSWTSTAGAGSSAAFGIICKTSTTAWHMMFMSGGNIYKTIFTWNGSTSGTFATSQVG